MSKASHQLKERVKELRCLYDLSRTALEVNNDLAAMVSRTLDILPGAMQFPELAEVSIQAQGKTSMTPGFSKSKLKISSEISFSRKRYGVISIGYRKEKCAGREQLEFLPEEKHLLAAVARELSSFIQRASVEEEKQKLQLQLQHVERLAFVGELSAGIAHELNEPLSRILGFAQLIKKAGGLNSQQSEDIERIVKASLYTREIIKKLMIFSRQMPRQITKVNLNAIVENILYFIDVRFQSRGISLKRKLDTSIPEIEADEIQMSQVLVNLLTNAVHAMPAGGEILVETKQRMNDVLLIVKDTGEGMSAEVKARIFEPFFTTKAVGQGTGLGLSVVQGIIDAHDGKIIVNSSAGKGTKFEIILPLAQKNEKRKKR